MRKLFLLTMLVLSLFILSSCKGITVQKQVPQTQPPAVIEQPKPVEQPPPPAPVQNLSCVTNSDCQGTLLCIDKACKSVASLYKTDCDHKCNFNHLTILTSDGEPAAVDRGHGDYAYAGAVEWKVLSGPDYCKGEDVIVPIAFTTKTTGKILSEEVVTLRKGETSKVLTHPTIKRVAFTVKVVDLKETCS